MFIYGYYFAAIPMLPSDSGPLSRVSSSPLPEVFDMALCNVLCHYLGHVIDSITTALYTIHKIKRVL